MIERKTDQGGRGRKVVLKESGSTLVLVFFFFFSFLVSFSTEREEMRTTPC